MGKEGSIRGWYVAPPSRAVGRFVGKAINSWQLLCNNKVYQRRRGGREEKCNVAREKEAIKSPACQDRCSSGRIRLSVAKRCGLTRGCTSPRWWRPSRGWCTWGRVGFSRRGGCGGGWWVGGGARHKAAAAQPRMQRMEYSVSGGAPCPHPPSSPHPHHRVSLQTPSVRLARDRVGVTHEWGVVSDLRMQVGMEKVSGVMFGFPFCWFGRLRVSGRVQTVCGQLWRASLQAFHALFSSPATSCHYAASQPSTLATTNKVLLQTQSCPWMSIATITTKGVKVI